MTAPLMSPSTCMELDPVPSGVYLRLNVHSTAPDEVRSHAAVDGALMVHVPRGMAEDPITRSSLGRRSFGMVSRGIHRPDAETEAGLEADEALALADAIGLPTLLARPDLLRPGSPRTLPMDARGTLTAPAEATHVLIIPARHAIDEHPAAGTVVTDSGDVALMSGQLRLAEGGVQIGLPGEIAENRHPEPFGDAGDPRARWDAGRPVTGGYAGLLGELEALVPGDRALVQVFEDEAYHVFRDADGLSALDADGTAAVMPLGATDFRVTVLPVARPSAPSESTPSDPGPGLRHVGEIPAEWITRLDGTAALVLAPPGSTERIDAARDFRLEDDEYGLFGHGTSLGVMVGDVVITPRQAADLIMADPRSAGRKLVIIACDTVTPTPLSTVTHSWAAEVLRLLPADRYPSAVGPRGIAWTLSPGPGRDDETEPSDAWVASPQFTGDGAPRLVPDGWVSITRASGTTSGVVAHQHGPRLRDLDAAKVPLTDEQGNALTAGELGSQLEELAGTPLTPRTAEQLLESPWALGLEIELRSPLVPPPGLDLEYRTPLLVGNGFVVVVDHFGGNHAPIPEIVTDPLRVLDAEQRHDPEGVFQAIERVVQAFTTVPPGTVRTLGDLFGDSPDVQISDEIEGLADIQVRPNAAAPYVQFNPGVPLRRVDDFMQHMLTFGFEGLLRINNHKALLIEQGQRLGDALIELISRTVPGLDQQERTLLRGYGTQMYAHVATALLSKADLDAGVQYLSKHYLGAASRVVYNAVRDGLPQRLRTQLQAQAPAITRLLADRFRTENPAKIEQLEQLALRLGDRRRDPLNLVYSTADGDPDSEDVTVRNLIDNFLLSGVTLKQRGIPRITPASFGIYTYLPRLDTNGGALSGEPLWPLEVRRYRRNTDMAGVRQYFDDLARLVRDMWTGEGMRIQPEVPPKPTPAAGTGQAAGGRLMSWSGELVTTTVPGVSGTTVRALSNDMANSFQAVRPQDKDLVRSPILAAAMERIKAVPGVPSRVAAELTAFANDLHVATLTAPAALDDSVAPLLTLPMAEKLLNQAADELEAGRDPLRGPSPLSDLGYRSDEPQTIRMLRLATANLSPAGRAKLNADPLFAALLQDPEVMAAATHGGIGLDPQTAINSCAPAAVNTIVRTLAPTIAGQLIIGEHVADTVEATLRKLRSQGDPTLAKRERGGRTVDQLMQSRINDARTDFAAIRRDGLRAAQARHTDAELWASLSSRWGKTLQKLTTVINPEVGAGGRVDIPVLTNKVFPSWFLSAAVAVPMAFDRGGRRALGIDAEAYRRALGAILDPEAAPPAGAERRLTELPDDFWDRLHRAGPREVAIQSGSANDAGSSRRMSLSRTMSRLNVDFGHAVTVSAVVANGQARYQLSDPKNSAPKLLTQAAFEKWVNDHRVEMAPLPNLPVHIDAHPGEPARIPDFEPPGDLFGPGDYQLLTNGTDEPFTRTIAEPAITDQGAGVFPRFIVQRPIVADAKPSLRVSPDRTIAMNAEGIEQGGAFYPAAGGRRNEFYATRARIDEASRLLRESDSKVALEIVEGNVIKIQGAADLLMVRPVRAGNLPAVCRDFAEGVLGGPISHGVLRSGNGSGEVGLVPINAADGVELTGTHYLAAYLTEAAATGKAAEVAVPPAVAEMKSDRRTSGRALGAPLPGREYGLTVHGEPAMDQAATNVGVNQFVTVRPGEAIVTQGIGTPGPHTEPRFDVDYALLGQPAKPPVAVGYHFAPVVADSADHQVHITLENARPVGVLDAPTDEVLRLNYAEHHGAAKPAGLSRSAEALWDLLQDDTLLEKLNDPASRAVPREVMRGNSRGIQRETDMWQFRMWGAKPENSHFAYQMARVSPPHVNPLSMVVLGGHHTHQQVEIQLGNDSKVTNEADVMRFATTVARVARWRAREGLGRPTVEISTSADGRTLVRLVPSRGASLARTMTQRRSVVETAIRDLLRELDEQHDSDTSRLVDFQTVVRGEDSDSESSVTSVGTSKPDRRRDVRLSLRHEGGVVQRRPSFEDPPAASLTWKLELPEGVRQNKHVYLVGDKIDMNLARRVLEKAPPGQPAVVLSASAKVGSDGGVRDDAVSADDLKTLGLLLEQLTLSGKRPWVIHRGKPVAALDAKLGRYGVPLVHSVLGGSAGAAGLDSPTWSVRIDGVQEQSGIPALSPEFLANVSRRSERRVPPVSLELTKVLLAADAEDAGVAYRTAQEALSTTKAIDELNAVIDRVDGDSFFAEKRPLLTLGAEGKADFVLEYLGAEEEERPAVLLSKASVGIDSDKLIDMVHDTGMSADNSVTILRAIDRAIAGDLAAAERIVSAEREALNADPDRKSDFVNLIAQRAAMVPGHEDGLRQLSEVVFNC